MIAFSHVPRTGGTSLRRFIVDNLGDGASVAELDSFAHFALMTDVELSRVDFLATHCGSGLFRRLPESATKITVLRDPVERVVSLYHHLRRRPAEVSYAARFAQEMSLLDFVTCDNPAVRVFVENTQAWHMAIDKNEVFRRERAALAPDQIVELALRNLRSIHFVGTTENLELLAARLADHFGWEHGASLRHLNNGPESRKTPLSSAELAAVKHRTALDLEVYRAALHIETERG